MGSFRVWHLCYCASFFESASRTPRSLGTGWSVELSISLAHRGGDGEADIDYGGSLHLHWVMEQLLMAVYHDHQSVSATY
jgi:hypothetical protein